MKKFIIFLFALWVSNNTQAATSPWNPIVTLGGGMTNTINLGDSFSFPIINPHQDEYYSYSPTQKAQIKGLVEAFLGMERPLSETWLLQIGCAYTQPGRFHPQGTFIQGAEIASQNQYQYQYDLTTRQVMIQTKWMRLIHQHFYPYVLIGLGAAINTASQFTTNVPSTLSYTRLYADDTSTSFAYRLGIGLDADLGASLRLGIGYRITNLGGTSLGNATINQNPTSGTLSQSAIYANEILAQLTYRF